VTALSEERSDEAARSQATRSDAPPPSTAARPPTSFALMEGMAAPTARVAPRVIAVANQKGGVGKTTTAVSLGACLAERGHRVLLIDIDPQANASTGVGVRAATRAVTTYDVLVGNSALANAVVRSAVDGLFLVPASMDLAGAEVELVNQFARESRLRRALAPILDAYDAVLIDCPPSLGLLTINALSAATELLVPIQCEYYALEGVGMLLRNATLIRDNVNDALRASGVLLTMFDPRIRLAEQVVADVRSNLGSLVYETVIPRAVRLAEAPGFGLPITVYDPGSRAAASYRALAEELWSRPSQSLGMSAPARIVEPEQPDEHLGDRADGGEMFRRVAGGGLA